MVRDLPMGRFTGIVSRLRLAVAAAKSSACIIAPAIVVAASLAVPAAAPVAAHEVRPAIADVEVGQEVHVADDLVAFLEALTSSQ